MALDKVIHDTELFQFERDTHQGPLFGEGANHFYWAGRCDGVEAQVAGGEDHSPLLDFDLLKIHPQMVNHGMGYYERWFRSGYQHRLGEETGTVEQIDKYRAMELAYGHAGFVGSPHDQNWQWVVREHHLLHPVQQLYGNSRPTDILYEVDGQLVTASAALALGETTRQRIRYDSGLTLWVNWRPESWQAAGRTLPQWGFLAWDPRLKSARRCELESSLTGWTAQHTSSQMPGHRSTCRTAAHGADRTAFAEFPLPGQQPSRGYLRVDRRGAPRPRLSLLRACGESTGLRKHRPNCLSARS